MLLKDNFKCLLNFKLTLSEFSSFSLTQNICCTWWGQGQKLWTGIKLDRRRYVDSCWFGSSTTNSAPRLDWACSLTFDIKPTESLNMQCEHDYFWVTIESLQCFTCTSIVICQWHLLVVNCMNFVMLDFRVQPMEIPCF